MTTQLLLGRNFPGPCPMTTTAAVDPQLFLILHLLCRSQAILLNSCQLFAFMQKNKYYVAFRPHSSFGVAIRIPIY